MKLLVKSSFLMIVLSVFLLPRTSNASHMYYIGTVSSFSNNQMVVEGKTYQLASNVKVVLRIRGSNGAIHEQKGRLSDISAGNNLTIKVSNGEIVEIEKIVSR